MKLALRYDMRCPSIGAPAAELYAASIEQCAWADELGFETVYLAEPRRRRRLLPIPHRAGDGHRRPDETDGRPLLSAHRRAARPHPRSRPQPTPPRPMMTAFAASV